MELDSTNGFLRVNIVSSHSTGHAPAKTGRATDANKCTVYTTFAHHGRNQSVQQLPDIWTPRSEGDTRWEYKSFK